MLRSEYGNASACLDALEAMRDSAPSGADALGPLIAQLGGEGFAPEEMAVEVTPDSAFTLALRPGNPAFDATAFERRLFGLLIEKDAAPLAVALFASLIAVARTNGSLSISVDFPETSRSAKIFAFRTQEASPEPTGVIEALCEKFSTSDISRL